MRDRGAGWAANVLRWDRPAYLPEDRTHIGFPSCKDPQKVSFGQDTLLQTGNSEVNGYEIGSLQEVSAHALWIWAFHLSPTLNFLGDGFPSVLSSPWSLSGPSVSLDGDTPILSTLFWYSILARLPYPIYSETSRIP